MKRKQRKQPKEQFDYLTEFLKWRDSCEYDLSKVLLEDLEEELHQDGRSYEDWIRNAFLFGTQRTPLHKMEAHELRELYESYVDEGRLHCKKAITNKLLKMQEEGY